MSLNPIEILYAYAVCLREGAAPLTDAMLAEVEKARAEAHATERQIEGALAEAEERGADWGIKAVAAVVDPILGFHQVRSGTLIPGLPVVAAEVCRAARERGDK